MNNELMFDPSVYKEQIKELNKGKYKRDQPEEIQLKKIAAAKLKREIKALKKDK